jgi:hypothetical protein
MRTKLVGLALALVMFVPGSLWAESLLENTEATAESAAAPSNEKEHAGLNLNVNGYLKSAIYAGRNDGADPVMQGSYGEFDLKGVVEKGELGRALVEIREDAGDNRGPQAESVPDIREAWAETHAGPLTVRLGRQIIVWGRADAINPTSNITPMNGLVLSSEYDDSRMGNELLQLNAKLSQQVNLIGIWVPQYRPDVLALSGVTLPDSISVANTVYPDNKVSSSSYALRLEATTGPIDGSLSYYRGYKTLPGFDYALTASGMTLIPTPYRMQAFGADFSTALGDYGLRGEACYKVPDLSSRDYIYVPASHFEYVVGVDRTLGDWNALVQYSGVYVRDFQDLATPVLGDPSDPQALQQYAAQSVDVEIAKLNRQFTGTADRVSHAATAQLGWSALADTLHVKLAGMYSFTTREFAINPSVAYDIADALTLTVGGRDIDGPQDSLNRLVNRLMSSAYAELKCSF